MSKYPYSVIIDFYINRLYEEGDHTTVTYLVKFTYLNIQKIHECPAKPFLRLMARNFFEGTCSLPVEMKWERYHRGDVEYSAFVDNNERIMVDHIELGNFSSWWFNNFDNQYEFDGWFIERVKELLAEGEKKAKDIFRELGAFGEAL